MQLVILLANYVPLKMLISSTVFDHVQQLRIPQDELDKEIIVGLQTLA